MTAAFPEEAERHAWATVTKETHGGKKSGSGRGRQVDMSWTLKLFAFVLLSALIYAVLSCHYRNRAADRVAEHTRERYRRIET
jgi:hypothetical protein